MPHENDMLPEDFDGSEEEKQQLENDLLKLKMQAEFGAHFGTMPGSPDLPPDIEKQFLEQIMAFHKHREENPPVPLREYLGNPEFKPSSDLSEEELEAEWERINALFEEKQLRVEFQAEYPLAQKYDFMADELMIELIDPPMADGQFLCFLYEDLHPHHDFDQRRRTQEFMEGFFGGTFDEDYLAPQLFSQEGQTFTPAEIQVLLDRFHGLFDSIREWDFQIQETSAQPNAEIGEGMPRLGFTEGMLKYTAVTHDGHAQEITGPFKLYMENVNGWWSVMHFYMHGFSWKAPAA